MVATLTQTRFRGYLQGWFSEEPGAVGYSRKTGRWTVRRSFFYRGGQDASDLARKVQSVVPTARVHNTGEKYVAFRGGDTIRQGSHWWVEFAVDLDHVATVYTVGDVVHMDRCSIRKNVGTARPPHVCAACGYRSEIGGQESCPACRNREDDGIETAGIVAGLANHSKRDILERLNRLTGCDHGRPQDWQWVEAARLLARTLALKKETTR